ncbi:hypothetical protein GCM10018775_32430 [Streptomyces umbrinus]|nr:hypothetical protein GCM10018775_32430 [Streptomyces umbrinus]
MRRTSTHRHDPLTCVPVPDSVPDFVSGGGWGGLVLWSGRRLLFWIWVRVSVGTFWAWVHTLSPSGV